MGSFSTIRFVSSLFCPSYLLVIMTCSTIVFCVVRLVGIPWFVMAWDINKSIYIGFSTLCVATHVKISAQRSQLLYTAQYIHGYITCTTQTRSINYPTQTSCLSARTPEVMNVTMEEVDEETRLRTRREMQRNNLKLKREQLKYHKIILEST